MNIYLAGCEGGERKYAFLEPYTSQRRLISYFYMQGEANQNLYFNEKYYIMLDSGAFSAFTQKKKIRIADYIAFLKSQNTVRHYYNLDVIGDEGKTWRNQRHMEGAGLRPMPVFHAGESFDSLRKCLDNYEYFAIGGVVGMNSVSLCRYLDRVFRFIGKPVNNKIHALGVTSDLVLRRYPWFSCDSTSWIHCSARGKVMLPRMKSGRFDFSEINVVHSVKTFKTDKVLLPALNYIKEQLNFPHLDVMNYSHRYLINAYYFRQYEKTFNQEN